PRLVVLHYTAMESVEAAHERLSSPEFEVSAHYLIARDGHVLRLVAEEARAWHAGAGQWQGAGDLNSRSIGIELDNPGTHPFPNPQMVSLETLLAGILQRWAIPPSGVIAHSDLAPTRKSDPGPRFDWRRLARQSLAIAPEPGPAGDLWADLETVGYDVSDRDAVLRAFRLRARPTHLTGPPEHLDAALAAAYRAAAYRAAALEGDDSTAPSPGA
ncbi:MAG: N-acetylmuramoyl-L-alanine amidase, partial [Pseudomonadota bacterium]